MIPKKKLNKIMMGYFGDKIKDSEVCVLDTDDCVVETYEATEVRDMKIYLDIRPAKTRVAEPNHLKYLFDKRIWAGKDYTSLVMGDRTVLKLDKGIGTLYGYLYVRSGSKLVLKHLFNYTKDAMLELSWAQKIADDLYRVIVRIDCGTVISTQAVIICCIFTDREFLGVEYAFDESSGEEIEVEKWCYPKGAIGSRLSMMRRS